MGATARTAIVGEFSVSDLLREAAERSISLDHLVAIPATVATPQMSGMLRAEEVQPGLLMSGYDLIYLDDSDLAAEMEPSIMCALLLEGTSGEMRVGAHPPFSNRLQRVEVAGLGSRMTCRRPWFAGQRTRAFGLTLTPQFLDRYAFNVVDDGLSPLRGFLAPGFKRSTLPWLPRTLEIADDILAHPYEGNLAKLYHETHALRFLLEVAVALRDQERASVGMGRLEYERACTARDILDRRLVDPPKALELAREVGINLTTLQANFKAAFGTTIFGYVRTQRLKIGRILMMEHGLRVAEAGLRVGFSNSAAFTAAYRRYFGHPPTAERGRRSS
mgnify:CR=1 FL=1